MNRFRSKKKGESAASTRRPSLEADIPPLPNIPSKSKTFRRNKKGGQPSKPEEPQIDLTTTTLPSSDDFRTSLLMPNLSARFSMLREQDDPLSKIGKANDDSVLFPKRASRLDLFNRQGLSDIVEVDSRRGSLRPPFAFRTESNSTDGYGTDTDAPRNGSIMSRAKPGEGNNMFGGRQKIYKLRGDDVRRGSGGDDHIGTGNSNGMGGRAIYESDVALSAFQRLREQEKEKSERDWNDRSSTRSSKEDERSVTPPLAHYNRKRETSSSTNSGPSYPRTSTAATSLASQRSIYGAPVATNGSSSSITSPIPGAHISPSSDRPGPPVSKPKRLYGHGLDQHMHEQQSSALHRLESLHRQRAISPTLPRSLQQSRSATNLQERYQGGQGGGPLYASSNFRAGSPPPVNPSSLMADFDLGLDRDSPVSGAEKNDSGYGRSPPLSPVGNPMGGDQMFMSALEPNDVGKATASGAFNKPKKQYNEQQYLQRQMQLQQGRSTPPPARPYSPSTATIDEQVTGRTRNNSQASSRSMNGSVRHPNEQPDHHNHVHPLNTVPEVQSPRNRQASVDSPDDASTSFLNGFSGSDVSSQSENETDTDSPLAGPQYQSLSSAMGNALNAQRPPIQDRPVRLQPERLPTNASEETTSDTLSQRTVTQSNLRTHSRPQSHSKKSSISKAKPDHLDADSPTLGPTNGLSGLVRNHLRNESDSSSIYPEQSPELLSKFSNDNYTHHRKTSSQPHTFFNQETLSDDEQDGSSHQLPKLDHPEEMPPPLAVTARTFLEQATALKKQDAKAKQLLGDDKAQRILGREAPRSTHESAEGTSWQDQLRAHHHARGGSTETEKEREAFATELAERRRAVQDKIKTFVESESRSASPGPGARNHEDSSAKSENRFGILKAKNSRTSPVGKNEQPSKAMKMLGITPGSNNPFPEESGQRSRYMNEGQRAQMPNRRPPNPPSQRSSPPSSSSRADRSNSEASDRIPDHRLGSHREHNRYPGPHNAPQMINPPSNFAGGPPRQPIDSASGRNAQQVPAERSQSAMSGRFRSNSRTNQPGYFEHRAPGASGTPANMGSSQRHSPVTPAYSTHSAPSTRETPPGSSNFGSPVMMSSPQNLPNYNRRPTYRKGSVNKHDISEPHFLSCTSSVSTVDLPPGASLNNGMEPPPQGPPPVPPFNPRRKRTQTLLQALGRLEKTESTPVTGAPSMDPYQEQSTFSADEGDAKPKPLRHKLRKSSSEGGNLNVRARQEVMMAPGPVMPQVPQNMSAAPSPSRRHFQQEDSPMSGTSTRYGHDGQYGYASNTTSPVVRQAPGFPAEPSPAMHKQHFPKSDVPASAVMF